MQFYHIAAVLAFLGVSANAAAIPDSSTSDDSEYVKGFPICGVEGFTETPGNYTETTHQQPGATLKSCLEDCRKDPTCKSVAYAEVYTGCYFFNRFTKDVQLIADDTSYFSHYDEICFPY